MGVINSRGVYEYAETDRDAKASNLLNRQSNALTALPKVVGGSDSMTLPASNGLRSHAFNLPLGLGGTPTAVNVQSRNPLGHGIEWRVSGKNATTFTVEARAMGTSVSVLFEFDFVAVR